MRSLFCQNHSHNSDENNKALKFDTPEEAEAPALESLVFQEIQAISSYFALGYEFYFWRTIDKLEIDFILYGQKGLIGIEVKRSSKIYPDDLKALKAFKSDYPIS